MKKIRKAVIPAAGFGTVFAGDEGYAEGNAAYRR